VKLLKCCVISLGSISSKWTVEALKKYFEEVDDLDLRKIEVSLVNTDWKIIYNGQILEKKYDCVFVKGSFRYVTTLRAISEAVYDNSYTPIPPEAFEIAHNKILTHLVLQRAKIPMPNTWLFASVSAAKKFLENANYPLIVKLPKGTQGKGVMYIDSYASASSVIDTLSSLRQPFLIQEYIETNGIDYRIIVIGEKVIGYKRIAKEGDKRSNIHAGGEGAPLDKIDDNLKKIALKTAKAMNSDIIAIDILPSSRGPLVIEVNISPGLQGITKYTKLDVADMIASLLYEKTKIFKEKETKEKSANILQDLGIKVIEEKEENKKYRILKELDFRGNKIILPDFVTKLAKFKPLKEYVFEIKEEELTIKKEE